MQSISALFPCSDTLEFPALYNVACGTAVALSTASTSDRRHPSLSLPISIAEAARQAANAYYRSTVRRRSAFSLAFILAEVSFFLFVLAQRAQGRAGPREAYLLHAPRTSGSYALSAWLDPGMLKMEDIVVSLAVGAFRHSRVGHVVGACGYLVGSE